MVRNLEIIGEAAKQLPAEFKNRHSAIPWLQRTGLRNRIVHNYAGIETRLEHFANSDSEVGVSDRRVEITTIDGVRDSQSTRASCFVIPNIRVIRAICGCLALPLFVCIRARSWLNGTSLTPIYEG